MRKIILFLFCAAVMFWLHGALTPGGQAQPPKQHIVVLYTGTKSIPVSVWLDERVVIEDTVIGTQKKPPIVAAVGVANLQQYAKVTARIGSKAYYSLIEKNTIDIVIVAHDTLKPIQLSRRPLPLK